MKSSKVASRYAQALLDLAIEQKSLDKVNADMIQFSEVCEESKELKNLLRSPIFDGKKNIGLSSGASVPRYLVDEIITKIHSRYPGAKVHEFENTEKNIVFPILQFKE